MPQHIEQDKLLFTFRIAIEIDRHSQTNFILGKVTLYTTQSRNLSNRHTLRLLHKALYKKKLDAKYFIRYCVVWQFHI